MKIYPISNYHASKYKNNNVSFQRTSLENYYGNPKKTRVFDTSKSHLRNLGEYLWEYENYEIKNVLSQGKYFSKKKTDEAFKKVMPYVNEVRDEAQEYYKIIEKATRIEGERRERYIEKQSIIQKKLFDQILDNKRQKQDIADIPNGILIYGDSEEDKSKLTRWIDNSTRTKGISYDKIAYNPDKPDDFFNRLYFALQRNKSFNEMFDSRSIIELEFADQMLSDTGTIEGRNRIAQFKNIAENVSKNYRTTFVINSSIPIEQLENAAIGPQRFELRINMPKMKKLTKTGELRLEYAKKELQKLKDKSDNVAKDFCDYKPPQESNSYSSGSYKEEEYTMDDFWDDWSRGLFG